MAECQAYRPHWSGCHEITLQMSLCKIIWKCFNVHPCNPAQCVSRTVSSFPLIINSVALLRLFLFQRNMMLNYYTGLFEMIVGVLTTCHTQYSWDRSICIFLINGTTLQVFVTYLISALYVVLLNKKNYIHSYLKCIVYDKLLKPRQSFRITLYFFFI